MHVVQIYEYVALKHITRDLPKLPLLH